MDTLSTGEALLAGYGGLTLAGKVLHRFLTKKDVKENKIARIYLHGVINEDSEISSPLTPKREITPHAFEEKITSALEDKVDGIIFDINSPGGAVAPSKEIADRIATLPVPTVALVKQIAASGGYWIASACDKIVANEFSILGSIGVILPHVSIAKLAEKYGITYDGVHAGHYKDMGNIFRPFTEEERGILQEELNIVHEGFITTIAENRKISIDSVRKLANGLIYHGTKAKELGLVDILGGVPEALKIIEEEGEFTHGKIKEYKDEEKGFISSLLKGLTQYSGHLGQAFGRGFYESVTHHPPKIQ